MPELESHQEVYSLGSFLGSKELREYHKVIVSYLLEVILLQPQELDRNMLPTFSFAPRYQLHLLGDHVNWRATMSVCDPSKHLPEQIIIKWELRM